MNKKRKLNALDHTINKQTSSYATVYVNSLDRISGSNANFEVRFRKSLTNVSKLKIHSFSLPNTIFVTNGRLLRFSVFTADLGTPEVVFENFILEDIDLSYAISDQVAGGLATLANLMNDHVLNDNTWNAVVGAVNPNFKLIFNNSTKQVIITSDYEFALRPAAFEFDAGLGPIEVKGLDESEDICSFLGFTRISHVSADVAGIPTLISDMFPSLDGHRFLYLSFPSLDVNALTSNPANSNWENNIVCQLPLGNIAQTVFVSGEYFHSSFLSVSYMDSLQCRLQFSDGSIPKLNAPVSFVVRFWFDEQ